MKMKIAAFSMLSTVSVTVAIPQFRSPSVTTDIQPTAAESSSATAISELRPPHGTATITITGYETIATSIITTTTTVPIDWAAHYWAAVTKLSAMAANLVSLSPLFGCVLRGIAEPTTDGANNNRHLDLYSTTPNATMPPSQVLITPTISCCLDCPYA
jgi:hypothetical protein